MGIAVVGRGRKGLSVALRLLRDGHRVAVHNRGPEPIAEAA